MILLRGLLLLCVLLAMTGCEEAAQAPAPPTTVPAGNGPTTSIANPDETSQTPDSGATATGGVIDAPPANPPP
jgi:hypothetical protein